MARVHCTHVAMAHVLHAILVCAARVWGTVAPLRVSTTLYIKRWDAINVMPCVNMCVCIAPRKLYEPFLFRTAIWHAFFASVCFERRGGVGMLAIGLPLPNTPDS